MPAFFAILRKKWLWPLLALPALGAAQASDRVAERVTLANGFDLVCDHHELAGNRVRLYTAATGANFIEVAAADVALVEPVMVPADATTAPVPSPAQGSTDLTTAELHEMLAGAGARHNLDVNLLASVVRAESGGHTRAVSKAGAQGLMQLMPRTAAQLGVQDSFLPNQNITGGAAYLDGLLTRYRDNLALALAAYNAGPAAVDRYHDVPPYRETRLYVARIIRDFNRAVTASRLATRAQEGVARAEAVQPSHSQAEAR